MSYIQIFRRNEKKYLLTPEQKQILLQEVQSHIKPDRYPASTICSLYFDTQCHDLIIQSIDKPLYKQKFRLRSYGVPNLQNHVFLEEKIKYQGIVNKRRFRIKLQDFYSAYQNSTHSDSINVNFISQDSPQIAKELNYMFNFYQLIPSWIICYDRQSYCSRDDPTLRITFDENLRSRDYDLRLELGDKGEPYFQSPMYVMEIKALSAMPIWLVRALSALEIYPVSFTKYGNIYKQSQKGIIC